MSREIEAKFKVETFAGVRKALRAGGARYLATAIQTDRYFDTPAGRLLKADTGVRIRRIRCLRSGAGGKDTRPQITFKGPARRRGRAKVRREVQTRIDDAEAVEEILRALGLTVTATIRKRRAGYLLGRCRIELDELPVIGRFVEIEGRSEKQILGVARRLGLSGRPIKDHYVNLLIAARRRR